jgi:oligopeptide transport system ATP-binding protein
MRSTRGTGERMSGSALSIRNLVVSFSTPDGILPAVNDFSLDLAPGECIGVVGESGAGKSQSFLAVMGLLAGNATVRGSASLQGHSLIDDGRMVDAAQLNALRGARIAMIFQDPMTSLTPHLKVGEQIAESVIHHLGLSREVARRRALELLQQVQVTDAERRLDQYPHELSGGMRQRVMIAIALACDPAVLIADEPTTALDVTIQAQILALLADLKRKRGMAMALITHDLGVVAGIADHVAVMYGGRIVETGSVREILKTPRHPYTQALLASMPRLDEPGGQPLQAISGQPPNPRSLPSGCAFHPRCLRADDLCKQTAPLLSTSGRRVACHHPVAPAGTELGGAGSVAEVSR